MTTTQCKSHIIICFSGAVLHTNGQSKSHKCFCGLGVAKDSFERGGGRGWGLIPPPPPPPWGGGVWTPPPPLQFKHGENIHAYQICKKAARSAAKKSVSFLRTFVWNMILMTVKTVVSNRKSRLFCRMGEKCVLGRRLKIVLEYARQCGRQWRTYWTPKSFIITFLVIFLQENRNISTMQGVYMSSITPKKDLSQSRCEAPKKNLPQKGCQKGNRRRGIDPPPSPPPGLSHCSKESLRVAQWPRLLEIIILQTILKNWQNVQSQIKIMVASYPKSSVSVEKNY